MRMLSRHAMIGCSMLALLTRGGAPAAMAAPNPPSRAAVICMQNMKRDLARTETRMRNQLTQAADEAVMVLNFMAPFHPSNEDLGALWMAAMDSLDNKLSECQEAMDTKAGKYMTRLERRNANPRMMLRAHALAEKHSSSMTTHAEELKDEFGEEMEELFPECDVESFDDDP